MSFWRKFFGLSNKSEQKAKQKKEQDERFTVRPERVNIVSRHGIRFIGEDPFNSQSFELANLSVSGMALIQTEDVAKPLHGMKIFGYLVIGDDRYPVTAMIRHIHRSLLGCEFQPANDELKKAIAAYLKLEILGVKLRRVSSRFVKDDPRGKVFWYSDGGANELFFVDNGQELLDFHLSFLGHYLEAKQPGRLRYGMVMDEAGSSLQIKKSAMVAVAGAVPEGILEAAGKVLENIEGLSAGHRLQVGRLLTAD